MRNKQSVPHVRPLVVNTSEGHLLKRLESTLNIQLSIKMNRLK